MAKLLLRIFLGLFLITAQLWARGVAEGMTREQVEAELGKPLSVLTRGDTAVLRYPNDGRVELKDGLVVRAVRVRHVSDPETPEEIAAAEAAKEEADAAKATKAEAEKVSQAERAAAEAELAKASADARKEMEAAVEQMSADPGQATAIAGLGLHDSPSHFWSLLGVGAVVQVVVGMGILKISFRWADVHADWDQMLWPAVAGMAGGVTVRAVGYGAWGMTQFFHVDDAVSYFALLAALLKTTHACTLQRAVAVAAAAKLMTLVVWTFLSVALSQMLLA